jgi:molybdopterin-containing oxidoreductase family membrane subunit
LKTEDELLDRPLPPSIDPGPDSVLGPGHNFGTVTDKIANIPFSPLRKTPKQWFFALAAGFVLLQLLLVAATYLFYKGIGIWGVDIPVGWGFAIVNFVWWIGIGHAGTLISAILLLLKQDWRTSINRFSEAMTLFAVACAGLFPVLHTGRPWLATGCCPIPTRCGSGRNLAARCFGTFSRFRPTRPSRFCSG